MKKYVILLLVLALVGVSSAANYTLRDRALTVVPTLADDYYTNMTDSFGLNNTSSSGEVPDFARGFWIVVSALTAQAGVVGIVLLFSPPFLMMLIGNGNTKLAAITGLILSPFIFMYITSNWMAAGLFGIVIALTAIGFTLYRRVSKS